MNGAEAGFKSRDPKSRPYGYPAAYRLLEIRPAREQSQQVETSLKMIVWARRDQHSLQNIRHSKVC